MEDKYNPLHILSLVWTKFWRFPGYQNSAIEDYSIFIEIKQNENECFLISVSKYGYLWKGSLFGNKWKLITDFKEFYEKKDLLKTVHLRFKDEPICIKNEILEPFTDYDLFLEYITR